MLTEFTLNQFIDQALDKNIFIYQKIIDSDNFYDVYYNVSQKEFGVFKNELQIESFSSKILLINYINNL